MTEETIITAHSSFGSQDFTKAFETGGSGVLADSYRDLGYNHCEQAEVVLKESVDLLEPIIGKDRVAQKILSIPVNDSLANWREVSGGSEREELLEVSQIFQEATIFARTYGCAAILPIIRNAQGNLVPLNVRLDTLAARDETYTVDKLFVAGHNLKLGSVIETDIYKTNHGWPKKLWIGGLAVHPSRVAFVGNYGRGSFFESIRSDLADYHEAKRRLQVCTRKNSAIVLETSIDKIREQLLALEETRDGNLSLSEVLKARAQALYDNLNDLNVAVINEGEKVHHYEQSNIDHLVKAVQLSKVILSGVSDIVYSRLFGRGVGGLATSSDTDFENYSQSLDTLRANFIEPSLSTYDQIIATVLNETKVTYTWNDTKAEEMRLRVSSAPVENNDPSTEGDQ